MRAQLAQMTKAIGAPQIGTWERKDTACPVVNQEAGFRIDVIYDVTLVVGMTVCRHVGMSHDEHYPNCLSSNSKGILAKKTLSFIRRELQRRLGFGAGDASENV